MTVLERDEWHLRRQEASASGKLAALKEGDEMTTTRKHYAALEFELDGERRRIQVPTAHGMFAHRTFEAARRRLERVGRRLKFNARGYIWPIGDDRAVDEGRAYTITL